MEQFLKQLLWYFSLDDTKFEKKISWIARAMLAVKNQIMKLDKYSRSGNLILCNHQRRYLWNFYYYFHILLSILWAWVLWFLTFTVVKQIMDLKLWMKLKVYVSKKVVLKTKMSLIETFFFFYFGTRRLDIQSSLIIFEIIGG